MRTSPSRTPSLRRHKPSGLAVVTLDGKDHYLGPWPPGRKRPTAAALAVYDRLIAEWLANGRRLPQVAAGEPLSVNELILAFWKYAERHYRREDGTPTSELADYRLSLRPLRDLYGSLPAEEFSPLRLKAVRQKMIEGGLCRGVINQRVGRIVRMFKWGVAEELIPETVYRALAAVPGLQRMRSEARERDPVGPVPEAHVEAVLPHVLPPVRAMIRLQQLTGARPGEVCTLRVCDIDRTGNVWLYRPKSHKTRRWGKVRVIALGPQAQEVLKPFLDREGHAFLFSPREAVGAMRAEQRARRKTKVQPSQADRRKRRPKKRPGDHYTPRSYQWAVRKACLKAGVPHWHPHQLRHSYATQVRGRFGLEAAQVALGHSQARVTEVYAERDLALAAKVAAQIG